MAKITFDKDTRAKLVGGLSDYLRSERDSSTELHQWVRRNYTTFRDLDLSLLPQR